MYYIKRKVDSVSRLLCWDEKIVYVKAWMSVSFFMVGGELIFVITTEYDFNENCFKRIIYYYNP